MGKNQFSQFDKSKKGGSSAGDIGIFIFYYYYLFDIKHIKNTYF